MGSSAWQRNGEHHGQQCRGAQWATQWAAVQQMTSWAAAHGGAMGDMTGSSTQQRNGRHHGQQHTTVQQVTRWAAAHGGAMGGTIRSSAWPASVPHGSNFRFAFIAPWIQAEQDIGAPISHNPKSFLIFLVTDYSSYSFYQTAGILN